MEEEIPQEQPEENWLTVFNSSPESKNDELSLRTVSQLMGVDGATGWGLHGGASYNLETATQHAFIGRLLGFEENDMPVLDPFLRRMSKEQRSQFVTGIKDILDDIRSGSGEFLKKSLRWDHTAETLKERLGTLLKCVEERLANIDATAI